MCNSGWPCKIFEICLGVYTNIYIYLCILAYLRHKNLYKCPFILQRTLYFPLIYWILEVTNTITPEQLIPFGKWAEPAGTGAGGVEFSALFSCGAVFFCRIPFSWAVPHPFFLVNPAPSLLILCRGNGIRGTWEWQSLGRERETPQKHFWMPLEFCWNSGTKLWILFFCRIWTITHQCSARSSTGGWLLLMPPRAPLSPRSQLRIRIPR